MKNPYNIVRAVLLLLFILASFGLGSIKDEWVYVASMLFLMVAGQCLILIVCFIEFVNDKTR